MIVHEVISSTQRQDDIVSWSFTFARFGLDTPLRARQKLADGNWQFKANIVVPKYSR